MKTILIIDDEFDITEALTLALGGEGYRVVGCADSRRAIALAREEKPHLILLDLMMPYQSGYEVLIDVRADAGLKSVPVVLMSATSPHAKQSRIGWNSFLKKPFTLDELLKAVGELAGTPD